MSSSLVSGLGPTILAVSWLETFIGIAIVALRGRVASRREGKLRWDFIWIVIALVFAFASTCIISAAVFHGLGNYAGDMSIVQLLDCAHWIWISAVVGLVPSVFGKFAIIAMLLAVHKYIGRKRRSALWGLAVLIGATNFVQLVATLYQCNPEGGSYLMPHHGSCTNKHFSGNFSYYQGALQAAADLALALWPLTLVWHLDTTRRMKIAVCVLMAFSTLPAIFVMLRVIYTPPLAATSAVRREFGEWMIFGLSEVWLVIILGSLPALRPLFKRVLEEFESDFEGDASEFISQPTGQRTQPTTIHEVERGVYVSEKTFDGGEKGTGKLKVTEIAVGEREIDPDVITPVESAARVTYLLNSPLENSERWSC